MCLAKASMLRGEEEKLIMDKVSSVDIEEGRIILTSLLLEKKILENCTLKHIDFAHSQIIIMDASGN